MKRTQVMTMALNTMERAAAQYCVRGVSTVAIVDIKAFQQGKADLLTMSRALPLAREPQPEIYGVKDLGKNWWIDAQIKLGETLRTTLASGDLNGLPFIEGELGKEGSVIEIRKGIAYIAVFSGGPAIKHGEVAKTGLATLLELTS